MSQLPTAVRHWVNERAALVPFERLKQAAEQLSIEYRSGGTTATAKLAAGERTAAYLAVRFPATYAAAVTVLQECRQRLPPVSSVLDLGAGCGAAALAATEVFTGIERITLIEADASLAGAGREVLPHGDWRLQHLSAAPFPEADLVVASFSLNELPAPDRDALVVRAWAAARVALVVIEPGSPAGFAITKRIRENVLAQGAHMVAPCPNALPCPVPAGDWCHFAARTERSALHRRLKEASLSYEDEKFAYIALAKVECTTATARIIRRPAHAPGLIQLDLCSGGKIEHRRVTKREKDGFRQARKANWGDELAVTTENGPNRLP